MALAFASRYRALTVLVAVTAATLLVHAGSVVLGAAFALALPIAAIQVAAGLAFFGFAAWTLRGDELGEADQDRARRSRGMALLTIGTAFFLAELGDKTMLATITLATTQEPWGTWLGSTAGMVTADAIAIGIGAFLGTRLPERTIKLFAAALFVVFGVLLVAEGFRPHLTPPRRGSAPSNRPGGAATSCTSVTRTALSFMPHNPPPSTRMQSTAPTSRATA